MRNVRPVHPEPETPVLHDVPNTFTSDAGGSARQEPPTQLRVAPLLAPVPPAPTVLLSVRRQHPWLLVVVDDTPSAYGSLVWALREAARREATVVAVAVADESEPDHTRLEELDTLVRRATEETGGSAHVRTAVLDAVVLAALTGATRGADLVVVGAAGKTLLRPAVPRTPARRIARGA
jgi:nucleotide-binding universal stress UspA family protein